METAIILPGFLNIGCRPRLGSYYTLRDHREEACLSQTSVANISLFCIGAEATWEIIRTAESWSWWQLACSVHSVLAPSRLRLYSAERSLASCHPRCLVSCSNTDSQQHDVSYKKNTRRYSGSSNCGSDLLYLSGEEATYGGMLDVHEQRFWSSLQIYDLRWQPASPALGPLSSYGPVLSMSSGPL